MIRKIKNYFFLGKKGGLNLFLSSFLALFAELLYIRWLPLRFRLLAYYSNLILLSALFGLGLGMILVHRLKKRIVTQFGLVSVLLIAVVVIFAQFPGAVLPLAREENFIWNSLSRMGTGIGQFSYLVLVFVIASIAVAFITLGHEVGFWFSKIKPLRAYSVNILGSILGVLTFSLFSYFSTKPVMWFLTLFGIFLLYLKLNRLLLKPLHQLLFAFTSLILVYSSTFSKDVEFIWSPYYEIQYIRINLEGKDLGFNLFVNKDSHQVALNLSNVDGNNLLQQRKEIYEFPYDFYQKKDLTVLVLGSGTGNDVAAALRKGATLVDAVEIDPVIAKLGFLHPERPYEDSRVRLYIDDARAFLERTDRRYDLITFGYVDSHRLFSSMSSIRLENYLYTKESLEKARLRLKEGGILSITYSVHEKWIADKIYNLLRSVFNQEPVVFQGGELANGTIFIVRNGDPLSYDKTREVNLGVYQGGSGHTWILPEKSGFLNPVVFSRVSLIPTDDWPHLFMKDAGIPVNYLAVLVIMLAFASLVLIFQIPLKTFMEVSNVNMFFLGAAFTLLETKGVTEIALVLGSTWVTNAVVILAVLVMILLGNLIVLKIRKVNRFLIYLFLAAAILFNYFFSFKFILGESYSVRVITSGLQVALPILFSSILFASFFRRIENSTTALGTNLLGAMFGGVLEYSSMVLGQRFLYLLALSFYILSFLLFILPFFRREAKELSFSGKSKFP